MNRKAPSLRFVNSSWVLFPETAHASVCDDDEWSQQQEEEYNGNYTFIVIEDNKKKCNRVANIHNNLQVDTNYEDE